jgi:hypothetical protein
MGRMLRSFSLIVPQSDIVSPCACVCVYVCVCVCECACVCVWRLGGRQLQIVQHGSSADARAWLLPKAP